MAKRIYTTEQKEARRLWQNERRRITNHESDKKYYPKLKEKRQKKSAEKRLLKPIEKTTIIKKKKVVKLKEIKKAPIKRTINTIYKQIKRAKPKSVENKFETRKQDLYKMKKVYIKELRMEVFIRNEQNEQEVREKYLNRVSLF